MTAHWSFAGKIYRRPGLASRSTHYVKSNGKGVDLLIQWLTRTFERGVPHRAWWLAILLLGTLQHAGADETAVDVPAKAPLLQLGPGDSIGLQVYGQPDLSTTAYIADDGTLSVPLAGDVQVAGLSPAQASGKIEAAFKARKILVDPHVTLTVTQSGASGFPCSARSVLRAVTRSNRTPTVFDLLAPGRRHHGERRGCRLRDPARPGRSGSPLAGGSEGIGERPDPLSHPSGRRLRLRPQG